GQVVADVVLVDLCGVVEGDRELLDQGDDVLLVARAGLARGHGHGGTSGRVLVRLSPSLRRGRPSSSSRGWARLARVRLAPRFARRRDDAAHPQRARYDAVFPLTLTHPGRIE